MGRADGAAAKEHFPAHRCYEDGFGTGRKEDQGLESTRHRTCRRKASRSGTVAALGHAGPSSGGQGGGISRSVRTQYIYIYIYIIYTHICVFMYISAMYPKSSY